MNPGLARTNRRDTRGFTLVEVMIASAILGLSLVVMFGFHGQAVRANMNAHRMTDCTYLAQSQLEQLLSEDWDQQNSQTDLSDMGGTDPATMEIWDDLEHPAAYPLVNAANDTDAAHGALIYAVSWDIEGMGGSSPSGDDWLRIRVRCTYPDSQFGNKHAATISSYRFRDS